MTYDPDSPHPSFVTPEGLHVPGGYLNPHPEPDHEDQGPPINVDDDGVAHFGMILPGDEPDVCGGCRRPWPCEKAVMLHVAPAPGTAETRMIESMTQALDNRRG